MSCLCGWTETCEHCWPPQPVEPIPLEDYGKSVTYTANELGTPELEDFIRRLLAALKKVRENP